MKGRWRCDSGRREGRIRIWWDRVCGKGSQEETEIGMAEEGRVEVS
jgi:hypothetical protein